MSRPTWDEIFSDFLLSLRKRSTCLKYQTSALIVEGTQILSMGYNGTFAGCEECSDYWYRYWVNHIEYPDTFEAWLDTEEFRDLHREWSARNEIHAECNALNWISKRTVTPDTVLYTYYSPCDNCAKMIVSYGLKKVRYLVPYPSGGHAIRLLQSYGVDVKLVG